ncbi:MAG: hypothetical protein IT337_12310, partial [Thermomicrobiales bacterium]|nr:hypothetical protein [Thermomicrobiales bacterium]
MLRSRDIPVIDRRRSDVARLVNTIVCLEQGVVRTVYRNADPVHHIMQKDKH